MPAVRIIGILCFVLAAGCAGVKQAPVDARARGGPLLVDPSLLGRNQDMSVADASRRPEAKEEAPAALAQPIAAPQQPVMTGDKVAENEPLTAIPAPPAKSESAAGTGAPPSKALATAPATTVAIEQPPKTKVPAASVTIEQPPKNKIPATSVAIEQPPKNKEPPPVAKKPEPPLDVEALKARLRDTDAIGVFTKLALKNQVDDLLQQFRAHYLSGQKTNVAALRQAYDMLVLKVLALIQDSDPSLARSISGSREAIWGILADPEKFNSVS